MDARHIHRHALWLLATTSLLLGGCTRSRTTQVRVHLHADEASSTRARTLRVRIFSAFGDTDTAPLLEKLVTLDASTSEQTFPFTIPVTPRDGDASRTWAVEAELMDEDQRVNRLRASGGYVEDALREVWLRFQSDCWEKLDCGASETCYQGSCVASCVTTEPEGTRTFAVPGGCDLRDGGLDGHDADGPDGGLDGPAADGQPADAASIPDGASIPQWKDAGDNFFAQQGQTGLKIDMLGLYLSTNGGAPVQRVDIASGVLPVGITLDEDGTGAGLGFITGDATDDPGDYFFTLTATNAIGTSAPSAEFKFNIWSP